MEHILNIYRNTDSEASAAQVIATHVKQLLNCETVSIFLFNETGQYLTLLYNTSGLVDTMSDTFGPQTPLFKMLKDSQDRTIPHRLLTADFPQTDTFFEQVDAIHSIAYSRVMDTHNNAIAVIRVINKRDKFGKLQDFDVTDLNHLSSIANIFGAALSARYADQRMISFLDSVTHELLAPMSGVKNTASFLVGYLPRNTGETPAAKITKVMQHMKDIETHAEMSISLVQGLTMFSRSGRMSQRDLDIKPAKLHDNVIEKSIRNLRYLISARQFDSKSIKSIEHWKWPRLKIDVKYMQQVFTNLLSNSIKYAYDDPEGFSILIEMKQVPEGYHIVIEDWGIGIDSDAVNKIFFPGERGENAIAKVPTGTGIGLTTAKNLLALHSMSIEVSHVSKPTQFTIHVPRHLIVKDWR